MSNQESPMDQPKPAPAETSTLAVISLIMGILTWILLPILGALIAVITGHLAKREIREGQGRLSGDGMATVGLVLGYVQLIFIIIPICIIVILALLGPSIGNVFSNIVVNI